MTCGNGIQRLQAVCRKLAEDGRYLTMDQENCSLIAQPTRIRPCSLRLCEGKWPLSAQILLIKRFVSTEKNNKIQNRDSIYLYWYFPDRLWQAWSNHTGPEEGVYPVEERQEVATGSRRLCLRSTLDNCGPSLPHSSHSQGPHPVAKRWKALGWLSTSLYNTSGVCENSAGPCVWRRDIYMYRRFGSRAFCPANRWQ